MGGATEVFVKHAVPRIAHLHRTDRIGKRATEKPTHQLEEEKGDPLSLFDTLGIADKVNEKAGKLSFGQQQRVAFIRALCQPFDFIFLDEPVSHLDDNNSALMGRILTEEADRQGAGVVVTSIGKHIELEYNKVLKL